MTATASFDAAVVGSGPNGLCAAIRLAQAGWSVVVYEAKETVGGGARTAELTLPGFRHDICSAIHPMAIRSPALTRLPLEAHGLKWIHPDVPVAHPLEDGACVALYRSLERTAEQLGVDGRAYQSLFGPLVESWDAFVADALGPLGIPSHPIRMARFGWVGMRSAVGLARAYFREEPARALFGGLAAHSVMPLDAMPSAAIGMVLGLAGHAVGWPMPQGGAQAISDSLASFFRSLGGVIRCGVRIDSLDQVESAGPVLFEVAPRALAQIAGDALPVGYRKRLLNFRQGPGVFKVDWALHEPIPWLARECEGAGTVHLGGRLDEMAAGERAAWEGRMVERPYVLLAQHSRFDPTRAPAGKHTAWAYCHVPNGSDVDCTAIIEDQVERYAPGFRDCIAAKHTLSCQDYERYNANYIGGDPNGGAVDLRQMFFRPMMRLNPYLTPNPRIALCSASTPPGGGIHGLCGDYAAKAVLAKWRR